ncbi:MAG TPA: cupin domain-containing protein [Steroidobacteraceae bacterium]|nr:cupin domain-containing protein [Steroidobacteraceae bacterium]
MSNRQPLQIPQSTIRLRLVMLALTATASIAVGSDVQAVDAPRPAVVSTLMTHELSGIAGKEAVVLTVEYPPGGSSPPHRHDANVFVYVLEGAINMQIEGQKQVTLTAGQTFYEGPWDVHVVSANASTTQPAKFLVVMVKDKNAAVGRPVGSGPSTPPH